MIHEIGVTLVFFKAGPGVNAPLDQRVAVEELPGGSLLKQRAAYVRMLRSAGGRSRVASLSMCYSADRINVGCREVARTCCSVRGNLFANYRLDYGLAGLGLALRHLWMLRNMDHVVAMTQAMRAGIQRVTRRPVNVIGNCVDETAIAHNRIRGSQHEPLRFVFVGSLTRRKQPGLIIDALAGADIAEGAQLDLVGDGPLKASVEAAAARLVGVDVHLHGQLADPLPIVARADAFVLPSMSEGVSRAALEALCLGVPCVLRRVDGNAELVHDEQRGILFDRDDELREAMLLAAREGRRRFAGAIKPNLLPSAFRQREVADRYLNLLARG